MSRHQLISATVASDVCKDLVLYDVPMYNPFRQLIPLSVEHPALLQIIVANSALHMSNTCRRSLDSDSTCTSELQAGSYSDALMAKQRALCLLMAALADSDSLDVDVTLAVVLLFIEFELIDSGRDQWRYHISGARKLIQRLLGPEVTTRHSMSPLRGCLISNCVV